MNLAANILTPSLFGAPTNFFNSIGNFITGVWEFVGGTIHALALGFRYAWSAVGNIVFYNGYLPPFFASVIIGFVVVAVVKAIFGR